MRKILMLFALLLMFGAGWMFANEVRPPRMEDLDVTVWVVIGLFGLFFGVLS